VSQVFEYLLSPLASMTSVTYFGLGCFWEPDIYFSKLEGVIKTTVGYSGGDLEDPRYELLGDHTETVKIEYDPDKISYGDLVKHFFKEHDPTSTLKTQYKSVIFTQSESEVDIANKLKEEEALKLGKKVVTEIISFKKFFIAEEYHQKYLAKK